MRILQIVQRCQLRGAEIFAAQLSNHLVEMGHEMKMVALTGGNAKLPFKGELIILGANLSTRLFDFAGWKKLSSLIRAFRPDIVQANAGDTLKYASMSKRLFGWKGALVFRNANKVSDFIKGNGQRWFNRMLTRSVDHVISVSELCRLDFVATYKIEASRTTTIPIGVEVSSEEAAIGADMSVLMTGYKAVLNVASLVPEKNHAALIRMSHELVRDHDDVRVVIVGDGRLRDELQRQIDELQLSKYVILTGYRNDVMGMMRAAQMLVVPSLVEGLPGVILEAFYAQLPVVATNVGGISEVVQNNATGWLVAKNDEHALLQAVKEVLLDDRSQTIIRNAKALVETQFLNSIVAARFAETYDRVRQR